MPRLSAAWSPRALTQQRDIAVRAALPCADLHAANISVLAIGGYGAATLAPFSDLDILFIPQTHSTATDAVLQQSVAALWSIGVAVGHSVRTLDEIKQAMPTDAVLTDALLQARVLLGRPLLAKTLRQYVQQYIAQHAAWFANAKLAERAARLKRFDRIRKVVEPNLKNGKGGLRDVQLLQRLQACLPHAVLTPAEQNAVQRAEKVLRHIRYALHSTCNRAHECLNFELQPAVAQAANFNSIEHMMRHYFAATTQVSLGLRLLCRALEAAGIVPPLPHRAALPTVPSATASAAELLTLFATANMQQQDINSDLQRAAQALPRRLPHLKALATQLRHCLITVPTPEILLQRLCDTGFLVRLLPAYKRVIGLTQCDMYHRYAVDAHTFNAIGLLRSFAPPNTALEPLLLALLFHDIGKGARHPTIHHDALGARYALRWGLQAGLNRHQAQRVTNLVRWHLVLSLIADRRDPEDPKTIRDLLNTVQTPEALQHLLYMTLADIAAVGHGVLSPRKELSLRYLYQQARQAFAGEATAAIQPIPTPQQRAQQVSAHHDDSQHTTHLVVCVPNKAGLFCTITHALALSQVAITRANVCTLADGTAFDTFVITEADGRSIGGFGRLERICQSVLQALQRPPHTPRPPLPQGKARPKRRLVPHVSLDNTLSDSRSVLEITATDKSGLLHTLAQVLDKQRLSVDSAFVNTYGDTAIDVFYVRDAFGEKVTHAPTQAALITALRAGCE